MLYRMLGLHGSSALSLLSRLLHEALIRCKFHVAADCLEGIDAQRVVGYALFKGGRDAKVGYPLEGYGDDIAGRSFHNGRFIQKMREKAAALPQ